MLHGLSGIIARGRRISGNSPSLYLDFLAGLTDSRITYSGGANGTRVNSAGAIVAATTPRFDYDPVTLAAKGLLVEEARTNSLRNNSMTGVAAGSPGTAPTNWPMSSTGGVLTRTIVGTGTLAGIIYFDVRYQFSAAGTAFITMEANNQIAAINGQSWSLSSWCALQGGSLTNISAVGHIISEYDAGAAFLTNGVSSFTPDATLTRRAFTRTNTDASTAFVGPGIYITATGAADITLRIGYPQMELGAFATSVIPTTTASVTRTADSAVMTGTNFSAWYNQSEGTFVFSYANAPTDAARPVIVVRRSADANYRLQMDTVFSYAIDAGVITSATGTGAVKSSAKIGSSFKTDDFATSTNGGTLSTDVSGANPNAMDQMTIGYFDFGGASRLNGHIRSIAYYPVRMSNEQLQALTS